MQVLLKQHGTMVDAVDGNGKSPLMQASEGGHEGAMRMLLAAKASVNVRSRSSGTTALMYAGNGGHCGAVQALLEAGAIVNLQNDVGFTALMCAGRHEGAMRVLLKAGAMVDSIDRNGITALMRAGELGDAGVLRLLLEARAAVDLKGITGKSALLYASASEYSNAGSVSAARSRGRGGFEECVDGRH